MYGLFIASGTLTALLLGEYFVKKQNLDEEIFWNVSFWSILSGIIGARIYYVIENLEVFVQYPMAILLIWKGGMVIIGGLIFGFFTALFLLKKRGQESLLWLDTLVPVLPLAQAIGRWGNYFNKELLPFALYEMATDFVIFIVLIILGRKQDKKGTLTFTYLALYSLVRYFLEPFRKPEINTINLTQSVSIVVFLVSLVLLWNLLTRKK